MIVVNLDGKRIEFDNLVDVSGKSEFNGDDFEEWLREAYKDEI